MENFSYLLIGSCTFPEGNDLFFYSLWRAAEEALYWCEIASFKLFSSSRSHYETNLELWSLILALKFQKWPQVETFN